MEEEKLPGANFMTPEAFVMISLALIFDAIGIICAIITVSESVSWLLDVLAMAIFSFWAVSRSLIMSSYQSIFGGIQEDESEEIEYPEQEEEIGSPELSESQEAEKPDTKKEGAEEKEPGAETTGKAQEKKVGAEAAKAETTSLKETEQIAGKEAVKAEQTAVKTVAKTSGKTIGRTALRAGAVTLIEIIPILGALPMWTWFVISELKEQ